MDSSLKSLVGWFPLGVDCCMLIKDNEGEEGQGTAMRFKLEAPPPAVKARAPPSKKIFEASLEKAKVKKKN